MKNLNKKTILILTIIAAALIFLMIRLFDANNINQIELDAGYDLQVTSAGKYSGAYMEDASDEDVSNVMMITVKNNGDQSVQYGEITLTGKKGKTAMFKFSTLEPGASMRVLESDRKPYKKRDGYGQATAANVAYFQNTLGLHAEKLQIQPLDGGLNVTNISGKDIKGEIIIYFKDVTDDMLMGGITYRGRITGGLKAGEIRQLMSENFTKENTKVMFITIDGE